MERVSESIEFCKYHYGLTLSVVRAGARALLCQYFKRSCLLSFVRFARPAILIPVLVDFTGVLAVGGLGKGSAGGCDGSDAASSLSLDTSTYGASFDVKCSSSDSLVTRLGRDFQGSCAARFFGRIEPYLLSDDES